MTYNVDYEICALVFLLLLMLSLLVIKHINDSQSKAYLILLCVTIFDLIFDIAGSIMINNCEYAPRGLNFATNTIFLLMQSILPYFLMVYVLILCFICIFSWKQTAQHLNRMFHGKAEKTVPARHHLM